MRIVVICVSFFFMACGYTPGGKFGDVITEEDEAYYAGQRDDEPEENTEDPISDETDETDDADGVSVTVALNDKATTVNTSYSETDDCDPNNFRYSTYEAAKTAIQNADFTHTSKFSSPESSWINGAAFYSCDNKTGFLILFAGNKDYLHQNVPRSVWNGFKNASSKGSYYNANLKGKYKYHLK